LIPNCDKIVPGMLMGAVRVNLPAIFISGGPMLAGRRMVDGEVKLLDLSKVNEGMGKTLRGEISESDLAELERTACPTCGSCSGMFTANSMNCLTEALGMGLPGNGTIPAVDVRRLHLAKKCGRRIVDLVAKNICARDIVTEKSLENAFAAAMALGCSTNIVLHLPAIAHEAGFKFDLNRINAISQKTPLLAKFSPATDYWLEHLDLAGGVMAVMKELGALIYADGITVSGDKLKVSLDQAEVKDRRVIKTFNQPYSPSGGLTILFGNLAPMGAVIKSSAVAGGKRLHRGPARVYDSEKAATEAIMKQEFASGDVIVIRYEGPKGSPGMVEMLWPTSLLCGMGRDKDVALITDGRFSGATRGFAVGHMSPEGAVRGPIAALRDGDMITIDLDKKDLKVELTDQEIAARLAALPAFEPKVKTGYLKRYLDRVTSASEGAVLGD
jgi:dihydroxy-acid dehydratase